MEAAKEVGSAATPPAAQSTVQSTTQAATQPATSTLPPAPSQLTPPPAAHPAPPATVSAKGLNISPGQAIMFFIKHPNVFVVVANSGQDFMSARTFNDKWVKGLRPIGDELAPVLDELLPSSAGGGTSGILSMPANQTEDTLADELVVKLNGMPTALGADPSGKPRRFNGEIIKEVAGFFLSNILPILLKTMLPGV